MSRRIPLAQAMEAVAERFCARLGAVLGFRANEALSEIMMTV